MTHLLQVCIPYYTLLYPVFVKQKIEKNKKRLNQNTGLVFHPLYVTIFAER